MRSSGGRGEGRERRSGIKGKVMEKKRTSGRERTSGDKERGKRETEGEIN